MLLTELILSKRGPLAKVWLSAHHERKLSKQQTLGVDVEESVGECYDMHLVGERDDSGGHVEA
jgi:cohesin complex subunit SCC1